MVSLVKIKATLVKIILCVDIRVTYVMIRASQSRLGQVSLSQGNLIKARASQSRLGQVSQDQGKLVKIRSSQVQISAISSILGKSGQAKNTLIKLSTSLVKIRNQAYARLASLTRTSSYIRIFIISRDIELKYLLCFIPEQLSDSHNLKRLDVLVIPICLVFLSFFT